MKSIEWKVVINGNKIGMIETNIGLPQEDIESHLTIIGLLENLKQKHLNKLKTLYEKIGREE